MPDTMAYLPAMSRLLGEVEQPTQTGAYQQGFTGNPQQLMQLLQSPAFQQQFHQAGINYDPSQMRQSPFFANSFMNQHPGIGGALTSGLANMAATPAAPEVSGAGSGLSRMAQGFAGGPEMIRNYQVQQLMAPMQGLGMTVPYQEFQRKQQLMTLLTQMEQDRANLANRGQQFKENMPQKVGNIGFMIPTSPEYAGQPQHVGSDPLFKLFQNQGQQPFPEWNMRYNDPGMLGAQQLAQHPERQGAANLSNAKADEQTKETKGGMAPAKVDMQKSISERNRAQAGLAGAKAGTERTKQGGKPVDPAKISGQYNAAEKQYRDFMAGLDSALKSGQISKQQYQEQQTQALATLQTSKANIDQAQGNPGASARGQQRGQQAQPAPGLVNPGAQAAPQQPQPQQGGQQNQNIHRDEAGNLWDMSNPNQPQYVGKFHQGPMPQQ